MKKVGRSRHSLKFWSKHSLPAVLVILWCMSGNAHAQLVPLTGTVPPNLSDIEGPGLASPAMPLKMEIYFKVRNKQLFDARADPDSPEYMRKMSSKERDAMFGPLQIDIDAVSGWLTSQGFQVGAVSVHPPAYLDFTGTVEQAERAFHVSIVASADGSNIANTQDPLIPARFADVILAISGLSNLGGMGHGTLFNCPSQNADVHNLHLRIFTNRMG
jgi:subtilase family serine protease